MSFLAKHKYLGDYKLGKTIGQGAFSKVKIGIHTETGRKVAIKIIDKRIAAEKARKAAESAAKKETKRTGAANAGAGGTGAANGPVIKEAGTKPVAPNPPGGTEAAQQSSDRVKQSAEQGPDGTPRSADTSKPPEGAVRPSDSQAQKGSSGKKGERNNPGAPQQESTTPSLVQRLSAEVQLLMRLDHPNIIRIFQVFESEDECFVVMEYAAGGELVDYIASKNHLSEKEARKFFRQMVSAIDHCHAAHVVHRDLKLENLLLNQDKNLLISDFGLGRTFSTHIDDYMKTFCGTPNYAAVELVSGIPYIGPKADVWAMGVVLYIMTAGKPPFVGHSISGLYNKIKGIDYKCPAHFSQELKNLLKKILVKDPKERISVEGIRNDAWVNFEEPGPPLRIEPKLSGKEAAHKAEDPASFAKLISSITSDTDFITYTFTQRGDLETRKELIKAGLPPKEGPLAAKHLAVVRRRRSLAGPQPGRTKASFSGTSDPHSLRWQMAEEDKADVKRILEEGCEVDASTPPQGTPADSHDLRSFNLPSQADKTEDAEEQPAEIVPQRRARRHTSALDPGSLSRQLARAQVAEVTAGNGLQPEIFSSVASSSNASKVNVLRRASTAGDYGSPQGMDQLAYDVEDFEVPGHQKNRPRRLSMDVLSLTAAQAQNQYAHSYGLGGPPARPDPAGGLTMQEIEAYHNLLRPAQKIRVGRFAFTVDTTSTEAPSTVFSEIHRALVDLQKTTYPTLRFERTNPNYYLFTCRFSKTGADVPPPSPALPPSPAPHSPAMNATSQRILTPGSKEESDTLCPPSFGTNRSAGSSSTASPGITGNILPITAQPEDDVVFVVEVCKLWLLKVHGIRIKRKWGSAFLYKEIYSMLIERIHL